MSFFYRKDLTRHRHTKHQFSVWPSQVYKCLVEGCQLKKEFSRKDKLKEHMLKQHAPPLGSQGAFDLATNMDFSKDLPNFSDSISISDLSYPSSHHITAEPTCHLRTTSTTQCNLNVKSYRCAFGGCNRTDGFTSRVDLSRHLRSVHTALLSADSRGFYRCVHEGCKSSTRVYPRKDNFKRHVTTIHPDVKEVEDLIER